VGKHLCQPLIQLTSELEQCIMTHQFLAFNRKGEVGVNKVFGFPVASLFTLLASAGFSLPARRAKSSR
jgi:hypothetical protein